MPRLLDVRPPSEFSICHLPGAISAQDYFYAESLAKALLDIPLKELLRNPQAYSSETHDTYVICRLGNDSKVAVLALEAFSNSGATVNDLIGGLRAWSMNVDPNFPVY